MAYDRKVLRAKRRTLLLKNPPNLQRLYPHPYPQIEISKQEAIEMSGMRNAIHCGLAEELDKEINHDQNRRTHRDDAENKDHCAGEEYRK